jgi:HK97 gp10 family phage protein
VGRGAVMIHGTDALRKALKKNANLDDVKKAVKLNTAEMQKEAEFQAPVDTGFMERSIQFSIDHTGLAGRVKSQAEYSGYVEYGTRFMSAQPFIYPAFQKQKKIFKKDLKRLVE